MSKWGRGTVEKVTEFYKTAYKFFSWVKFCTNLIITIKHATSQQHEYARLDKKKCKCNRFLRKQKHIVEHEKLKYLEWVNQCAKLCQCAYCTSSNCSIFKYHPIVYISYVFTGIWCFWAFISQKVEYLWQDVKEMQFDYNVKNYHVAQGIIVHHFYTPI